MIAFYSEKHSVPKDCLRVKRPNQKPPDGCYILYHPYYLYGITMITDGSDLVLSHWLKVGVGHWDQYDATFVESKPGTVFCIIQE